ncbi:unnamed protein product [Camellia sinensis]
MRSSSVPIGTPRKSTKICDCSWNQCRRCEEALRCWDLRLQWLDDAHEEEKGPRPGFFPDDQYQKKDGTRDNDWTCPKCGNVNFSFRTVCNMRKCNTPKAVKSDSNSKQKMPDGSWKCEKCNNINYPFRTKCNRQSYGADKPFEGHKSPSEPAEENNQFGIQLI